MHSQSRLGASVVVVVVVVLVVVVVVVVVVVLVVVVVVVDGPAVDVVVAPEHIVWHSAYVTYGPNSGIAGE